MSVFGDMATDVLADLAGNAAQTLQYRTTPTGAWFPFTGALLVPMDPMPIVEDTGRATLEQPQMATCRAPLGAGLPLLKAGYGGGQVKDENGVIWGIESLSYRVSHTHYVARRTSIVDAGPALGRT